MLSRTTTRVLQNRIMIGESFIKPKKLKSKVSILGYTILEEHYKNNVLDSVLQALPAREAEILRRRTFGSNLSHKCVGQQLDISSGRVQILEKQALMHIIDDYYRRKSPHEVIKALQANFIE